jgi:hypothetical protein
MVFILSLFAPHILINYIFRFWFLGKEMGKRKLSGNNLDTFHVESTVGNLEITFLNFLSFKLCRKFYYFHLCQKSQKKIIMTDKYFVRC